jgi:hypothetical protein
LLGWGVFNLISGLASDAGLTVSFGLTLIIVGLTSFYLTDEPGMYLIYTGAFLDATLMNLFAGSLFWLLVTLVSAIFALREYFLSRQTKQEYQAGMSDITSLQQVRLPWLSLLTGSLGLIGFCGIFAIGIFLGVAGIDPYLLGYYGSALFVSLSSLGILAGLASLVSGYKLKAVAIIGIVMASLTIALFVGMVVLAGSS